MGDVLAGIAVVGRRHVAPSEPRCDPPEAVIEALKQVRHKLLLVQLHRRSDAEPEVRGDVRVIDCETREAEDVSVTPALLKRYRRAYEDFQTALAEFARQRGAGLLRIDVDEGIVPQLAQVFEAGRYVV